MARSRRWSMGVLFLGRRKKILIAAFVVLILVSAYAAGVSLTPALKIRRNAETALKQSVVASPSQSSASWTWPTTTMQEPGYTNGTYTMGALDSVEHLNIYLAEDLYSFMLLDEIYDSPVTVAPNGTIIPWLATSWNEMNVSSQHLTTFDPLTGNLQNVSYIWVVHIRPGVTWTDWTSADASSTYVFSNHTSFSLYNTTTGTTQYFNYTYNWSSTRMLTYYVQSADFVLSWLMLSSSFDFSGTYLNVVNVVPDGNLTVDYYLNAQSASFVDYALEDPILPYNVWINHDWSETPGAWNYTGAPNGYDSWNMNYNAATGVASGLVGTGPFMMNGGYGMPTGQLNAATGYWDLIVNPHYFVQYVPALRQWTPKFFELSVPKFSSVSDAATAEKLGQLDTIEQGLPPTFIPTISTMPNTYIYHKPASSFGYVQLNSRPQYAPLNITAFRQALNYATDKAYISAVIEEGYNINGQNALPVADSVWYNATVPQYNYNPQLALSMIKNITGMSRGSNGNWYYFGKPVSITIQISTYTTNPLGVEGAEVIAQDWDAIGIPTTVEQMSFTTQVANTISYTFQATDLGLTGIYGDPTGDFVVFYNSNYVSSGFYFGPYTNITIGGVFYTGTQVNDLMNNLTTQLNLITNFSKRINIADEIQGIAAQESTMIGLGYPIDILEFTNTSFVGVVRDTLPYSSFMYWNFLSLHLRSKPLPVPSAPKLQLEVGMSSPQKIYWDGMYGNITVEVRDQYGSPVPGANVVMGYTPSGPLVNITSNNGTTNSAGEFEWEFQVSPAANIPYTSDYGGQITVTAAASLSSSSAAPNIGTYTIDVSPYPVEFKTTQSPTLVYGAKPTLFSFTVLNPSTGQPVNNYSYTIQVLSGALNMVPAITGQTLSYTTSFSAAGFGFQNVTVINGTYDYDMTSVSGVTGANGTASVWVSVNDSAVNFTAMGNPFESWIFIGNYAVGGPVGGIPDYFQIGEMTSASNS
ncbi:MAG: ABC transporter substrate-binding protein, partial [Methanomassiliicoccales archaeon]